jgi:hypothetical protein
MFNCKVGPDKYGDLRREFFRFISSHNLTIREAEDVLAELKGDLQDQVCSGRYGLPEANYGSTEAQG